MNVSNVLVSSDERICNCVLKTMISLHLMVLGSYRKVLNNQKNMFTLMER